MEVGVEVAIIDASKRYANLALAEPLTDAASCSSEPRRTISSIAQISVFQIGGTVLLELGGDLAGQCEGKGAMRDREHVLTENQLFVQWWGASKRS